jgi:hypothetical protein
VKVTIDSSDPLADALRVIGALYKVSIAQVDAAQAANNSGIASDSRRADATANGARRAATKKSTQRATAAPPKRSSPKPPPASTADIRSWALANGHKVSSRGTLPASVNAAYAAAHAS